jgi:hypothetical protein
MRTTAESVEDLAAWVTQLTGCPPVTDTKIATCSHPLHADDQASWFYVEGDPSVGVARLRCIAGGHVHELLDSADHWTYPHAWECPACSQSIAEVVYGINEVQGVAQWMVVAARCVECGEVAGITDLVLANVPMADLLAQL